jgi:hypothetical protein
MAHAVHSLRERVVKNLYQRLPVHVGRKQHSRGRAFLPAQYGVKELFSSSLLIRTQSLLFRDAFADARQRNPAYVQPLLVLEPQHLPEREAAMPAQRPAGMQSPGVRPALDGRLGNLPHTRQLTSG